VPVPSQKSEQSCIFVIGLMILGIVLMFFVFILQLKPLEAVFFSKFVVRFWFSLKTRNSEFYAKLKVNNMLQGTRSNQGIDIVKLYIGRGSNHCYRGEKTGKKI
jgi:hypothetical protein